MPLCFCSLHKMHHKIFKEPTAHKIISFNEKLPLYAIILLDHSFFPPVNPETPSPFVWMNVTRAHLICLVLFFSPLLRVFYHHRHQKQQKWNNVTWKTKTVTSYITIEMQNSTNQLYPHHNYLSGCNGFSRSLNYPNRNKMRMWELAAVLLCSWNLIFWCTA